MLQRVLSIILGGWEWEPAPGWKRHLLFIAPAAVLLAAVVYVGAVRTHACGHDIMQLLDGAWRVLNGQRPHVDFYSPLGPLLYLVTAAGLALAGLRAEGVGYGVALFGAAVGIWGYRLSLARMRLAPAAATGVFLVLLSVAPVPLGAGPATLSHAMLYNRFGFALLSLVLLEVLEEPKQRAGLPGGVSTGAAVGLLLFLKASYFLVAVTVTLAFYLLGRRPRRGWAGLGAGFGAVVVAALGYLRFQPGAFLADQLMAAGARGETQIWYKAMQVAYRSIDDLLLLLLVAMLVTAWGRASGLAQWKWPLAALAVFGSGILLMSTNAQDAGLPLSVVLCLLMAGSVHHSEAASATRAACALAACLLLAASASLDAVSLAQAVREKHAPPPGAGRFLPPRMSGLLLYDLGGPSYDLAYSNGARYADYINSGLRLLQAESQASESVALLEQSNPFSYALLREPGRGGFTFLAYGSTFTRRDKPSVQRLFGGADLVMVPKRNFTERYQYDAILETYLPGIQSMFTLAAETPQWWLYRRKR